VAFARNSVQINPCPADEAGVFVAFGRMTNQISGFVDDEQVGVFINDIEQFFQTRKI
jgi:hypothetical protein